MFKRIRLKIYQILIFSIFVHGCVGVGSKGVFGTGVSIAFDPRSVGTQIDDSIMQKSVTAKILARDKKYFISIKTKVLDGRIFITGKVDSPEEKLIMTKRMLIDSKEKNETRIAIIEDKKLIDFESEKLDNNRTKGNIYLAKIIRVEL